MKYLLVFALVTACMSKEAKTGTASGKTTATTNLQYIGVYENRCDSCPEGPIRLQLFENFAFSIQGSASGNGTYKWSADGKYLTLEREGLPEVKLIAAEKALVFESTGDTLFKVSEAEAAKNDARTEEEGIPAARWTLVEMNGKPTRKTQKEEPFINVAANRTFTAYAGCNGIGGRFEVKGNSIQFMEVVHTEMACEGAHLERPFVEALNSADNFIRNGKSLQLRNGPDIIAKFEVVVQPQSVR